ncbi:hypothetical protein PVNG_06547 [Plasmodium vivax North Korean]|uniref:Uncharacterized protein n=1 Tax=Plasmodium vivax North Korean TaxID=1035514 RepID=A0A0J9TWW5_PLAVI|nr:hypothetical protein PVNG_06547 [Plasmodium vivax North Korean]
MINGRKNRSVKTKNYIINVNCYTWINNSHGLFDYESENFYKKCFKIKCLYNYYYILKDDINVEIKNEEEINKIMLNNSSMKLICKIKYINNNYQLIPCIENTGDGGGTALAQAPGGSAVPNTDGNENAGVSGVSGGIGGVSSNNAGNNGGNNAGNNGGNNAGNGDRVEGEHGDGADNFWVIVKYLKNKSSVLHEDDIIKLGRVKLKIKKIITNVQQEREYNKSLSPFDDDECETDAPEMAAPGGSVHGVLHRGGSGPGVLLHGGPTAGMEQHPTGGNAPTDKNTISNNYVSGSINPHVSLRSSQMEEDQNVCINCGAVSNGVEESYNLYDDVDEGDEVSDAVEGSEPPREGENFPGRNANLNRGEANRPQESDINLASNNSYVDDFYLFKGNALNGELSGECRKGGRDAQSKNGQNEDDVAVFSESPFGGVLSQPSKGKTQGGGGSPIDQHSMKSLRAREHESGATNRLVEPKANCSGAISQINDGAPIWGTYQGK